MSDISFSKYLLLGALTFVFVGLLTPIMRKIALSVGAVDAPTLERKAQKEPVPYLGGVAIAIGVVGASYAALLTEDFTTENFRLASFVLVPAIAISAMGLIDDLKGLQPWPRLIAQTFTGVIVAVILTVTDTMGVAFGNTFLNYTISVLWIVGVCNSINFFDNHDGGAAGTVAVISLFLFFIIVRKISNLHSYIFCDVIDYYAHFEVAIIAFFLVFHPLEPCFRAWFFRDQSCTI